MDEKIDELKRAGLFDKDSDYDGMLGKSVEELLKVFSKQGHSGASAMMTATLFYKLIKGEVLSPLTNNIDEWMEVGENMWQNKRCPNVFSKDSGKTAYWLDGKIFEDKDGYRYTNSNSSVDLKLPCMLPEQITIRK